MLNTDMARKCSTCGSDLITLSTVTEQLEGSKFPQTTTIYRCSNEECQEEKDKQAAKRLQLRKEKEQADERRSSRIVEAKKTRTADKLKLTS
jgi:aspartate carbamoyltransferase regulatory subunit